MSVPLHIGLTGGIGSGKTTACDMFSELGVPVIDADKIAHDLVAPGQPSLLAITRQFGTDVLDRDGVLDRKRLREMIFDDPASREKLEAILHPLVYKEIEQTLRNVTGDYCIVCIPLLLETGSVDHFHRILVIDVPEAIQVERTSWRDRSDPLQIQSIIDSQISRSERLQKADDIINNNGDLDSLREQVEQLHDKYVALSHINHEKVNTD